MREKKRMLKNFAKIVKTKSILKKIINQTASTHTFKPFHSRSRHSIRYAANVCRRAVLELDDRSLGGDENGRHQTI